MLDDYRTIVVGRLSFTHLLIYIFLDDWRQIDQAMHPY
jgi:hypothetical protein